MSSKPLHAIVLDAGPILKNDPGVSSLQSKAEIIVTSPSILKEIKDVNARSRMETLLQPFLTIMSPSPQSIKFVSEFAKKSGDLGVMSPADVECLALTYQLECERGGRERLRTAPRGQKVMDGSSQPKKNGVPGNLHPQNGDKFLTDDISRKNMADVPVTKGCNAVATDAVSGQLENLALSDSSSDPSKDAGTVPDDAPKPHANTLDQPSQENADISIDVNLNLSQDTTDIANQSQRPDASETDRTVSESESGSGSDGWITPSNVAKYRPKDMNTSTVPIPEGVTSEVACITTDYAMQV